MFSYLTGTYNLTNTLFNGNKNFVLSQVIEDQPKIRVMEGNWSPLGAIREVVEGGTQEDPFYVMDLGEVVARYNNWRELLPRVEPFYGKAQFVKIVVLCAIKFNQKSETLLVV